MASCIYLNLPNRVLVNMKHSTQQFLRLVVISIRVRPVQDYGRQKRRKRRDCRRWSRQRTWRRGDSLPLLRVLYPWKWVLREICLLWNAFDPCHIFGKFTIYNCMAQHFKVYVNIHLQIKIYYRIKFLLYQSLLIHYQNINLLVLQQMHYVSLLNLFGQ